MNRLNNYINLISSYKGGHSGPNGSVCDYLQQIHDAADWAAMRTLIDNAPTAPVDIEGILSNYSSDPAWTGAQGNAAALRPVILGKIAGLCPVGAAPVKAPTPAPVKAPTPGGPNKPVCDYLQLIHDAADWAAMRTLIDNAPTAPIDIEGILSSYSSDPAWTGAQGNAAALRPVILGKIAGLCPPAGPPVKAPTPAPVKAPTPAPVKAPTPGGPNKPVCDYLQLIHDAADWAAMRTLIDNAPTAPIDIEGILSSYSSDPAWTGAQGNAAALRPVILGKIAGLCPPVGPPVGRPPVGRPPVGRAPVGAPILVTTKTDKKVEEYYVAGEPDIVLFKVFVYKTINGRDQYVGQSTCSRNQTVKSVLDAFKQSGMRCLVSSGKMFVTSLDPKDFYVSFANLNLKYDQVELFVI